MTNIGNLLTDAVTLMCTGMIVVFLFLTVLVYVVQLMSKLLPKESPPSFSTEPTMNQVSSSSLDPKVIAAISTAIHQYRTSSQNRTDKEI